MSGRTLPLIVAHRGASDAEPEHTEAAYARAFAEQADGVECDVRLTADRQLVCVHDRRAERTSDGTGVISRLPLETLAGFNWGTAANPSSILTLPRLMDLVENQPNSPLMLIETKHPIRFAGATERAVVAELARRGLAAGDVAGRPVVRVMSFSALALQRMRRLAPQVPTVFLVDAASPRRVTGWVPPSARRVGLDVRLTKKPSLVRRYAERGLGIYVWTVNEENELDRCVDLGVEAVITNRPGKMRALLGAGGVR